MVIMTTKQEDIELCTERFRELIQEKADPPALFKMLDDIMFDYAYYAVNANAMCGPMKGEADRLYLLKDLRDLFIMENGGNNENTSTGTKA